ncbi:AAA family ATPase [Thermoclostridium stercorarium subsp. leptospartum DSM 9219]|uniref:ATP-dependent RecD2 DNA helicase n=1 Tax=Thermoclostridium stercorarium subsp. leptospartum DSM 9219 TaxID=1346611 RepID=A0A1B1YNQ4_THEST|nr:ATP-dependent RecD-like DNA helicase [Thermoclostridium stercorarium]ANX02401.1 AAA family ATPase [Thermoclostridium stercorarium subsp. leptospartum DSM 9219]
MERIEGIVEDIIFCNRDNWYTVCDIRSGRRLITVVGYMPDIAIGETVVVSGTWTVHQDYGKQLKVETCERVLPTTTDAIYKYLASGIIKGIGETTAKKIVDRFGEDTLRILQFEPQRLSEIKGISEEKALQIGQAFIEREQMRQIVMFLQKYGISATYAVKVWKKFGNEAVNEIKRNPYRLTDEDINIGFKIADRVAISMGIDIESEFRIASGIQYALSKAVQDGHVYLPSDVLIPYASRLLDVSAEAVERVLSGLIFEESVCIEKTPEEDRVYLSPFFKAEQCVARKLAVLSSIGPKKNILNLEKLLEEVQEEQRIEYTAEQLEAIRCSATESILVVTGGPGTGKTTLIRGIISIFEKSGLEIVLAAPTGRAAKRMTEATGKEAKTIHRLLEMEFSVDESYREFRKNERDPIKADAIIIDEMSMVDILLMHSLLKAVEPGTRLILVGDVDQLPSVGPGKVLSDIIESECLKVIRLNTVFRQAGESSIVINAHRINKGIFPEFSTSEGDFFFIPRSTPKATAQAVLELCTARIPEKFGLDPMKDIQVLSPSKKGDAGIYNLNALLQQCLNPPESGVREKNFRGVVFRENDRVMQIKNNYNLPWTMEDKNRKVVSGEGVFNGDMGIIREIDPENDYLTVLFDDGKIVEYSFDMLDELEHSYAITVHKSQGSEFPAVVVALSGVPPMLRLRNLLYTAITRARQLVVIVGDIEILRQMVNNATERERYTGLKERLIRYFE